MRFLLFVLGCFSFSVASGKCASSGITCWPKSPTINTNGILILEFYAESQRMVSELDTSFSLYLKGKQNSIKLQVMEILKGEFQLTQVVLKPVQELVEGEVYELLTYGLKEKGKGSIKKWSNERKDWVPYRWTAKGKDLIATAWVSEPTFISRSYYMHGCGPAVYQHFSTSIEEKYEALVKTTVTNHTTGTSFVYYLFPEEGKLAVGHGMCSGPFTFKAGNEYSISFSLTDASGNIQPMQIKPYNFVQPVDIN